MHRAWLLCRGIWHSGCGPAPREQPSPPACTAEPWPKPEHPSYRYGVVVILCFYVPMAGGKIYLNCWWRFFFFTLYKVFLLKGILHSSKFFLVFVVFVILWNVLSSLFSKMMRKSKWPKVHKLSQGETDSRRSQGSASNMWHYNNNNNNRGNKNEIGWRC